MRLSAPGAVISGACAIFASAAASAQSLADRPTAARASDGSYISWREHRVDDEALSGIELRGGDGLVMADLDRDGHLDIVSVHEGDDEYDGVPRGHIRIAFGGEDPDAWHLASLASGYEAGGVEDVAVGDLNGDGWLDVVAACELAHLIYFENPGAGAREAHWRRLIPSVSLDRGSFVRVFLADLNGDGSLEVVTPNKGAQDPREDPDALRTISFFDVVGNPLEHDAWVEHVLTEVPWPINSEPVDLNGDGRLDIVAGSVAEQRMFWFENLSLGGEFEFAEHRVALASADPGAEEIFVHAFNMDYVDLNGDGRLDIVTFDTPPLVGRRLVWLEQPETPDRPWLYRVIGDYGPDRFVGIAVADINGDGEPDVMTGGYSLSSRASDEPTPGGALGRLAWYENQGGASGWIRHDISRRQRGMFDKLLPVDLNGDGHVDFAATRGNSGPFDGVLWLEQVRTAGPRAAFARARATDSPELPLPPDPAGGPE